MKRRRYYPMLSLAIVVSARSFVCSAADQTVSTKVVLLGTGTPHPSPGRSGPATAIVAGDRAYLVDFGPGVVRRAAAAAIQGTPGLRAYENHGRVGYPLAFRSHDGIPGPDAHACHLQSFALLD